VKEKLKMGKLLTEIAKQLRDAQHKTNAVEESSTDVKVQLIYAFNGTGKTRLSREFKQLVAPKKYDDKSLLVDSSDTGIIYYNAFTEDLFYWDNDLENDTEPKLVIQPNNFTKWIFEDQGKDQDIIANFQHYTDDKLTPQFNQAYNKKDKKGNDIKVEAFSEVTFSFKRGNDEQSENIKISKGEESNFIWCVFYSLLVQIVDVLNEAEPSERETNKFDQVKYVFIDDPVSSLDENHLIELAVDLAHLIKESKSELKFIITTHSPLFYNVLYNELKNVRYKKYILKKDESGEFELFPQHSDSPFSYHLYLKSEIEKAISSGHVQKYHYNFLRNILEKTSTFLGYEQWGDLLKNEIVGEPKPYLTRIINISSHSKHAGEEITELTEDDKRVLRFLLKKIHDTYHFHKAK
jgi:wobble nucleotide-excising tRNase